MKDDDVPGRTYLCISCDFKGGDFIKQCHTLGNTVYLVTGEKNRQKDWPYDCIRESFFMPEDDGRKWNLDDLIKGTAYLMRMSNIVRVIALDDYDVQKAALLREEFRIPGMGQTTARNFYDKLAMRMLAQESGIPVPAFSALFEDASIAEFLEETSGPWLVKPRSDAGAIGIRKVEDADAFWNLSESLGDSRYHYLIECFEPGGVYHVDSLTVNYKVLFTRCSAYRKPPFEIAHGGGIFSSTTLPFDNEESKQLKTINNNVLKAFGMRNGASHSEFIRSEHDGKFYFLETSARVGGAHLADMVEMASGVSLWKEWAKIEQSVLLNTKYSAPDDKGHMAGIVVSLIQQAAPDYSSFECPELVWTLNKDHHIGLIYAAKSRDKVFELLDDATERIRKELHAAMPLKE